MKVKDLINNLGYESFTNDISNEKEISGVYIGDLLSYVMGNAPIGSCWVTVQAHLNCLAVASLREFPCIIISNTPITTEVKEKALEEEIALLYTTDDLYTISKKLMSLGL